MIHFHQQHDSIAEYKIKLKDLKNQVMSQRLPVREIHRRALREMTFDMAGRFCWKKVRNGLQRLRRKQMPSCPDLQTMINLLETNDFVRHNYGKLRTFDFYQGTINSNILVFANLEVIAALPERIQIFADATFKVCPFNMYQLIVILAEIEGSPRPIIFGIMPGKKQSMYEAFFDFIKLSVLRHGNKKRKPISAMMDFEKALRNAVKQVFRGIKIQGCNFHHLQALRKRAMKTEGLSTKIFKNSQHHYILKMFMRISLLPITHIDDGLDQLKRYISSMPDISDDFQQFIIYYEKTWYEVYKKHDWSVSDAFRRTNNNIEGLNSYIKKLIPRNPSPYKFLDSLLDLAYETSSSLSSAFKELSVTKDRSKLTKKLHETLEKLRNDEISELTFLKIMAKI
uniref:Putative recombinase n=1 Tax=Chironomus tentans TaxID=7153 RepID=Q967E3_CHITE|nr:putative recombinase [Chironomus tentans]